MDKARFGLFFMLLILLATRKPALCMPLIITQQLYVHMNQYSM